tara:strand:+ start:222 stop:473 length:252 start_codon:yes stop_codon:yes gene_type:complete
MFENFGTAIVQAVGFLGVFGFFIYRLLSEKNLSNPVKKNKKIISNTPVKRESIVRGGLFSRNNKVLQNKDLPKKENKKGWFKR